MKHILFPVLMFALMLLGSAAAHAHAHLDRATPAAGSNLGSAPKEVVLNFTESLEAKFSRIEVRSAAGARVDDGKVTVNGSSMRVGLKSLAPGTYRVTWRVLSVDTHRTQGSFSFTVAGK